jgi:hypothetical protein
VKPKLAAIPPCLCSHDRDEHPVKAAPHAHDGRCMRTGCGCLRYRPDITLTMAAAR